MSYIYIYKYIYIYIYMCVCVCVCAHARARRVIQNDCRGFNNLLYTIHLRLVYIFFLFNRTTLQDFVTCLTGAL